MVGKRRPLDNNVQIVDQNGRPTEYFIRWAQENGLDVANAISEQEAEELIDDAFAAHSIVAGVALDGGGSLSNPVVTIDHSDQPLVTPGVYGSATKSAVVTVDQQGHVTEIEEADITGGGGGGGGPPNWAVQATGTGASQAVTIPPSSWTEEYQVFVFVNGLRMETDEYTLVGDQVTLTTNASGDSIEIVGWDGEAPPPGSATDWRFFCTANNGGVLTGFGDIYLYDGLTNLNTAATVSTKSAYAGIYVAANGADGNPTTWCLSDFADAAYGWWFQWSFASAQSPTSYMIDRGTTDTAGYLPNSWELQYFDTGTSTWIAVDTQTGQSGWATNEQRTFTL